MTQGVKFYKSPFIEHLVLFSLNILLNLGYARGSYPVTKKALYHWPTFSYFITDCLYWGWGMEYLIYDRFILPDWVIDFHSWRMAHFLALSCLVIGFPITLLCSHIFITMCLISYETHSNYHGPNIELHCQ